MSPGSALGRTGMATAELANVQMWYDRRGQGDPLVALHPGGAGVDSRALAPNVEALSQHFRVYTPEQRGHGHTPDVEGPITFELMAQDTITFIETVVGGPVHLLGCSDGAILALTIALRRPDLVRRLVFTSKRSLMGSLVNRRLTIVAAVAVTVVIVALNVYLLTTG